MANTSIGLSAASLRRAADIQDKIEALQRELASLLGGRHAAPAPAAAAAPAKPAAAEGRKRRRNMSPEARARIGAAARARWARYRAQKEKAAK